METAEKVLQIKPHKKQGGFISGLFQQSRLLFVFSYDHHKYIIL